MLSKSELKKTKLAVLVQAALAAARNRKCCALCLSARCTQSLSFQIRRRIFRHQQIRFSIHLFQALALVLSVRLAALPKDVLDLQNLCLLRFFSPCMHALFSPFFSPLMHPPHISQSLFPSCQCFLKCFTSNIFNTVNCALCAL